MTDAFDLPTVKRDICFADSMETTLKSLKGEYDDSKVEGWEQAQKLMLFGIEDFDKNVSKFAQAFNENGKFDSLEIFGTELSDKGQKAFAEGLKSEGGRLIRVLDIDNCPLNVDGAKAIIEGISEGTKCESLNLQGSVKEAGVCASILKALKANPNVISKLDLKINGVNADTASHLASLLQTNSVLKELDLFYNDIEGAGATHIANALRNDGTSALRILNLCCNKIGDNGATALASMLRTNVTLVELHLALNEIKDDGAIALCDALNWRKNENGQKANETLEKLDLSANQIKDKAAESIAATCFWARHLKFFDFTGIEPGEGWEFFETVFFNMQGTMENRELVVKFSIVDVDDSYLEKITSAIGDNPLIDWKRREKTDPGN